MPSVSGGLMIRQPRSGDTYDRMMAARRYVPKAERLRRHAEKMRQRPYRENGILQRAASFKAWETRRAR